MDIRDYLRRINYQGSLEPTLQTLRALHEAHLLAVPFENLSIHYGQPIVLQEEALFDKIVRQSRGGFCYELNGLFAWLLRQLGFQVTMLSAGVFNPAGMPGPEFDHLALLVHQLSGADWLADVGFGDSFRLPLRFEAELEQTEEDGRAYRLRRPTPESSEDQQPDYWSLQQRSEDRWESQYRFTLQPRELLDFNEMCHFQQTSPASHFTWSRICSLATPEGRISLSDLRLITTGGREKTEQALASEDAYASALAEYFNVTLHTGRTLYSKATAWVTQNYSNAEHLVKTEIWLLRLLPDASEALRLSALTHDMERAFPGPDSPKGRGGVNHEYNRAHSERSATIVGAFLREQGADELLVKQIADLVRAHEYGGWPEANFLQAADSLSFLEVNISIFLKLIPEDDDGSQRAQVREKFAWMYDRIQVPEARTLAEPYYAAALERLESYMPA